jgi:hypothetical protein
MDMAAKLTRLIQKIALLQRLAAESVKLNTKPLVESTNPIRESAHQHILYNWGPSSLLFIGYRRSFPRAKWPEREVNLLPPCSNEVRD